MCSPASHPGVMQNVVPLATRWRNGGRCVEVEVLERLPDRSTRPTTTLLDLTKATSCGLSGDSRAADGLVPLSVLAGDRRRHPCERRFAVRLGRAEIFGDPLSIRSGGLSTICTVDRTVTGRLRATRRGTLEVKAIAARLIGPRLHLNERSSFTLKAR